MTLSKALRWPEMGMQCEEIINDFPRIFNQVRDMDTIYFPDDACHILMKNDMIKPCSLSLVSDFEDVFSPGGIKDINESLDKNGIYVFTMHSYSFLYGKIG